jgi:hypothetical protein
MRMNTGTALLESTGISEQQQFRVNTNSAKLFDILQNSMYTDKILAPVREYMCNALDAHKQIGATTPFKVWTPNGNVTEWVVRDYGPGLSHTDVMELFTTYLMSSKDNSDDLIGGFGLGSKSAFAYTDQFIIISYFNGTMTRYAAFIGANRLPEIAVVDSQLTDEPNGLEIRVPVRKEDIGDFVRKSIQICADFPTGSVESAGFSFEPFEYLTRTDMFGVSEVKGYSPNAPKAYVLMGNVRYPLPATFQHKVVLALSNKNKVLTLFANIGNCSLAPSREALSFDRETKEWLEKTCDAIFDELTAESKKLLSQAKNMLEYGRIAAEISVTSRAFVPDYRTAPFLHTFNDASYRIRHDTLVAAYNAKIYNTKGPQGGPPRLVNASQLPTIPPQSPICVAPKDGRVNVRLSAIWNELSVHVAKQKGYIRLSHGQGPLAIVMTREDLTKHGITPDFDLNTVPITTPTAKLGVQSVAAYGYYSSNIYGSRRQRVELKDLAASKSIFLAILEDGPGEAHRCANQLYRGALRIIMQDKRDVEVNAVVEFKKAHYDAACLLPNIITFSSADRELAKLAAAHKEHIISALYASSTKQCPFIAAQWFDIDTKNHYAYALVDQTTLALMKAYLPLAYAAYTEIVDEWQTDYLPRVQAMQTKLENRPALKRLADQLRGDLSSATYLKPFALGELK